MARKKVHEEHVNHEAWAIPYGDLITLLLAFFVVMYATSSVNEGKYRVLSNSLVTAFNGNPARLMPIQIGSGGEQGSQYLRPLPLDNTPRQQLSSQHVHLPMPQQQADKAAVVDGKNAQLDELSDKLSQALAGLASTGAVRLQRKGQRLELAIGSDTLFSSGSAELAPEAVQILEEVALLLRSYDYPLGIEGHTDNIPIATGRFPSNWELSAGRAGRVIRLFERAGIAGERMILSAYGEQRPEVPNTTPEGRDRNRRVMVIIQAQPQG